MISVKDYKVEITKLTEEDGGGYLAHIPELDCYGDGNTAEEAMVDVYAVAEDLISIAMEDGKEIPKPMYYKGLDEFSGKLTLRIPKTLHKLLNQRSKDEECSINQLLLTYISMGLGDAFGKTASLFSKEKSFGRTVMASSIMQNMWDQPRNRNYGFDGNRIAVTNRGVRAYE